MSDVDRLDNEVRAERSEIDASAAPFGQEFGNELTMTIRRLMNASPYIVNVMPGWVKAVWHNGLGQPTGYCSMIVPEGFGRNEDVVLNNVGFGLGKLPEAGQPYLVYFGSDGKRWIKLMPPTGFLYWMEEQRKLYRIIWPPESTPEVELVYTYTPPAGGERRWLVGLDGEGVVYTAIERSRRPYTIETIENWGDVDPNVPPVRHATAPFVDTTGVTLDFVRQFRPSIIASARGRSGVVMGVGTADAGSVKGWIWTRVEGLYTSADRGESWTLVHQETTTDVSLHEYVPPLDVGYQIITSYRTMRERELFGRVIDGDVEAGRLGGADGQLAWWMVVFDHHGQVTSNFVDHPSPSTPADEVLLEVDLIASNGAMVPVFMGTEENHHYPDLYVQLSGVEGDGWRLLHDTSLGVFNKDGIWPLETPLAQQNEGFGSTDHPSTAATDGNNKVFTRFAQDWSYQNGCAAIYDPIKFDFLGLRYTIDYGETWQDFTDDQIAAVWPDHWIGVIDGPLGGVCTGFIVQTS